MAISYNSDDFVIVEQHGKKFLVLVTNNAEDSSQGILESSRPTGDDEKIEFGQDDVITNLGPRPKIGTVHGIRVEPWFKTIETPLGECEIYFRALKEFRDVFLAGVDTVSTALKKRGLRKAIAPVTLEARIPRGKNSHGMYYFGKGRDGLDKIVIQAHSEDALHHLLYHEFAHAIWSRLMSDKAKAAWVLKYHAEVDVTEVDTGRTADLLDAFLSSAGNTTMKDFLDDLDSDDQDAFSMCLDWVHSYHFLNRDDMGILHRVESEACQKLIREVWPSQVVSSDIQTRLTDYSTKKADEFWAEAFALFMTNKKSVPDDVAELVQRTLTFAQRRAST